MAPLPSVDYCSPVPSDWSKWSKGVRRTKASGRCPKCQSQNVWKQYPQVTTSGSYLVINEGVRPRKGTRFLLAYVCKDCGFTELYRTERPGLIPPKIPD